MKLFVAMLGAICLVASAQVPPVPPRPPVMAPPVSTDARLSKLIDVISVQTDAIRALNERIETLESRLALLEAKAQKQNGR